MQSTKNKTFEALIVRDRDRLWCLAACEVLEISDIAKLTKRVNELREETSAP